MTPILYARWAKNFNEMVIEKPDYLIQPQKDYITYVARRRAMRSKILLACILFIAFTITLSFWKARDSIAWGGLWQLLYYAVLAVWAISFVLVHRLSSTYNIIVGYMTILCLLEQNYRSWGYPVLMRPLNSELRKLALLT